MTIGEAMVRFYLEFLGAFAANSVFFLAVGVLLGCWIGSSWARNRNPRSVRMPSVESPTMPLPDDGQPWLEPILDEPVFAPGVAKVGDQ